MFATLAALGREVIRERVQAGINYARLHGTKGQGDWSSEGSLSARRGTQAPEPEKFLASRP